MTQQLYELLRASLRGQKVIRVKYYPNKDGQERVGWRTVQPLDIYVYRGVQYCLCWFVTGSSVSGGTGFRLFFVKNIQDIQETDSTTQQPFAMHKAPAANYQVLAWHMIQLGQIEKS